MLRRERRGQWNPNQLRPARNLSDEYGEEQYFRGENIIRVSCDQVGVEVRGGGSSGGSGAVLGGGAVCEAGVMTTRRGLRRRPGRHRESGPPRGRREAATRRCLERRQVLDLGIPSKGSIVDPRR